MGLRQGNSGGAFFAKNKRDLTPAFLTGEPFIELRQVGSTNNYATGLVHAGMARSGTAVFAHHQTAGKGQRAREWKSEAGMNIAMSLVLQPPGLMLSQSFLLSAATSVGVQRFLAGYAGGEIKVKWPNDIYWRDRKTAGILIENIVQGNHWKAAVVGIGVNVNQTVFDGLQKKAVSLKQITGREYDPLALARELCTCLSDVYATMWRSPAEISEEYKSLLYKLNGPVRLKKGSRVFEATVKGVTASGELVVHHAVEENFAVGEVEWMRNE